MMNFRQIPNYFMGFFKAFKNMFWTAQKSRYWMKKIFNDKDSGARILNQLVLVKNAKV